MFQLRILLIIGAILIASYNLIILISRFPYNQELNINIESSIKLTTRSTDFTRLNNYDGEIYMFWAFDSKNFSYWNFKSLESILLTYPNAEIVIRLIAPKKAEYYKIERLLSKHQFEKYTKNRFNVTLSLLNLERDKKLNNDSSGLVIWEKWMKRVVATHDFNIPISYYLLDSLIHIYQSGGILFDFTYIHRNPFETAKNIFNLESSYHFQPINDNHSSFVFYFSKKDQKLDCILRSFEFLEHENISTIINIFTLCFINNGQVTPINTSFGLIYSQNIKYNSSTWKWLSSKGFEGKLCQSEFNDSNLLSIIKQQNLAFRYKITQNLNFSFPKCSHYSSRDFDCDIIPKLACNLHFSLPGFMKSGTSFLYEMIVKNHYSFVHATKGVQFKETGCYLKPIPISEKISCFPFIESHDMKYFGDATVYYSQRRESPQLIAQDNKDIKIIFSLRDPIERTISHFRFDYKKYFSRGFKNINDCLALIFNSRTNKLLYWKTLAENILNETNIDKKNYFRTHLINSYFEGLRSNQHEKVEADFILCSKLIVHSIYYIPIYYWMTIFPPNNIMIIPIESMNYNIHSLKNIYHYNESSLMLSQEYQKIYNPKRNPINISVMTYKMNHIYRFLGVPEVKNIKLTGRHETTDLGPFAHHQINRTLLVALQGFYRPFILLLQEFKITTEGF